MPIVWRRYTSRSKQTPGTQLRSILLPGMTGDESMDDPAKPFRKGFIHFYHKLRGSDGSVFAHSRRSSSSR